MCTLLVARSYFSDFPLVVAANRDERYARAASGPQRWAGEPFVAPRDEVAGGTWLGWTEGRMFVGITNRASAFLDPNRESRGALVTDALRAPSAAALHLHLADLDPSRYNGFHLVYVDASDGFITWSDGVTLHQQALGPGLHVVTERSFGGDPRREDRLKAAAQALGIGPVDVGALQALLRVHDDENLLAATCVHAPAIGYGTRSSMVLTVSPERATLLWADGPPCVTPYVDRSELLAQGSALLN